jgi:hypothetical protein
MSIVSVTDQAGRDDSVPPGCSTISIPALSRTVIAMGPVLSLAQPTRIRMEREVATRMKKGRIAPPLFYDVL